MKLSIAKAADVLLGGCVIAYPTEAVYGLGCDPGNETAVRRIIGLSSTRARSMACDAAGPG